MKIAVVGSGISGLVAAHKLQHEHQVTLIEARDRIGGHSNTQIVEEGSRPIAIDTGFIVFNTKTYPNFVRLLGELGVAWAPSDMGFSVRSEKRDFEYNARNLSTLFSQRKRLFSKRHWQMLFDILRFFEEAPALLDSNNELPIVPWLLQNNYSEGFIDDHLLPLLRAVWSADLEVAESFPAQFMIRFFANHGFLQLKDREPWLTIPGGSKTYINAMLARFTGQVRLGTPVVQLRRTPAGIELGFNNQPREVFDHVVLAGHADQSLKLLSQPTAQEREILGVFKYQPNEAVLHTDTQLMPHKKQAWASWNVHLDDQNYQGACLSYWMNQLQPLNTTTNYFVTLNYTDKIRSEHIIRSFNYSHPIFSLEAVEAQKRHSELINHLGVSYCGAYWRYGFHEDGVISGLRVAHKILRKSDIEAAA